MPTRSRQPTCGRPKRTFQLIAQVAGRTGRGNAAARLVQTTSPEDPAVKLHSKPTSLDSLSMKWPKRTTAGLPVFTCRRVIFRARRRPVRRTARDVADKLRAADRPAKDVRILGAAPAPVIRLRTLWRFHLQIAARRLNWCGNSGSPSRAHSPAGRRRTGDRCRSHQRTVGTGALSGQRIWVGCRGWTERSEGSPGVSS